LSLHRVDILKKPYNNLARVAALAHV
jgi:hypothetical protein